MCNHLLEDVSNMNMLIYKMLNIIYINVKLILIPIPLRNENVVAQWL
jgi:hypothetical protein